MEPAQDHKTSREKRRRARESVACFEPDQNGWAKLANDLAEIRSNSDNSLPHTRTPHQHWQHSPESKRDRASDGAGQSDPLWGCHGKRLESEADVQQTGAIRQSACCCCSCCRCCCLLWLSSSLLVTLHLPHTHTRTPAHPHKVAVRAGEIAKIIA